MCVGAQRRAAQRRHAVECEGRPAGDAEAEPARPPAGRARPARRRGAGPGRALGAYARAPFLFDDSRSEFTPLCAKVKHTICYRIYRNLRREHNKRERSMWSQPTTTKPNGERENQTATYTSTRRDLSFIVLWSCLRPSEPASRPGAARLPSCVRRPAGTRVRSGQPLGGWGTPERWPEMEAGLGPQLQPEARPMEQSW